MTMDSTYSPVITSVVSKTTANTRISSLPPSLPPTLPLPRILDDEDPACDVETGAAGVGAGVGAGADDDDLVRACTTLRDTALPWHQQLVDEQLSVLKKRSAPGPNHAAQWLRETTRARFLSELHATIATAMLEFNGSSSDGSVLANARKNEAAGKGKNAAETQHARLARLRAVYDDVQCKVFWFVKGSRRGGGEGGARAAPPGLGL